MQLIESYFNETLGKSISVVKHRKRQYYGYAWIHPEDKEKASKYTGSRYAEMRAEIKALKAEHKREKAACEECRKFVKACSQYKNFDKDSSTAKAMYRQLNRWIKRVNQLADEINQKINDLNIAIKQKEIVHKALERKRTKEE